MRKKRHVYISGPMTGLQYYNGPAFVAMERALRIANPHILSEDIYNPYDFVDTMKDLPHPEAVRLSLLELLKSDEDGKPWYTDILVLEGYEESVGSSLEVHAARRCGINVTLFDEFDANDFRLNGDERLPC